MVITGTLSSAINATRINRTTLSESGARCDCGQKTSKHFQSAEKGYHKWKPSSLKTEIPASTSNIPANTKRL
jgi:hypothetical protein